MTAMDLANLVAHMQVLLLNMGHDTFEDRLVSYEMETYSRLETEGARMVFRCLRLPSSELIPVFLRADVRRVWRLARPVCA